MKKILCYILLFLCTMQLYAQKEFSLEGVSVPRTITFENKTIQLNGFGTRSKMWIDVYVQALYLTNLSQDAKFILNSDTEMAIRIQVISNLVTSKKLFKALNKGIVKSVGEEKILQFAPQLKDLEKYLGSEETTKGDAFNLIYNPNDKSIWIYKNDKFQGKVNGFEFKKVFFGVWLADNPVDEDLKNDLLGY